MKHKRFFVLFLTAMTLLLTFSACEDTMVTKNGEVMNIDDFKLISYRAGLNSPRDCWGFAGSIENCYHALWVEYFDDESVYDNGDGNQMDDDTYKFWREGLESFTKGANDATESWCRNPF